MNRTERLRWPACALLVLGLHAGVALVMVSQPLSPPVQMLSAVMLELAPMPVEAPKLEPIVEPEPEPQQTAPAERQLEPPPPLPPVEPPPPVAASEPAEAVLPPPPPPIAPKKPPPRAAPPRREQVRPIAEPPPPTAPPATPQPAAAAPAQVPATWQSRLLAHLMRFKRYPAAAQARCEQGVALLRFTMTRDGIVTGFRVERSSGHPLLDQEVLDLIQRAQPLPALPPEMAEPGLELVVPIRFELR